MTLPLLERAKEQSATFLLTTKRTKDSVGAPHCASTIGGELRIPQRSLQAGEQYRFHFDMTKCIGCKCCVVACNEQNGNPAEINWRRVGEIEGGWYPNTQRLHLSMGCNHCLEPTCMTGCPVDAYSKDAITGVVIHSAQLASDVSTAHGIVPTEFPNTIRNAASSGNAICATTGWRRAASLRV